MYGTDEVFKVAIFDDSTTPPTVTKYVNLFKNWHDCTPEDVVEFTRVTLARNSGSSIVQDFTMVNPS